MSIPRFDMTVEGIPKPSEHGSWCLSEDVDVLLELLSEHTDWDPGDELQDTSPPENVRGFCYHKMCFECWRYKDGGCVCEKNAIVRALDGINQLSTTVTVICDDEH